ncbi:glycosyltransferase 87 family protein [Endomicrobium proavitum]|uniref:O-antigen ligase n=1 Tax=Endomicrobium proavitum TaxID=1408281 RepID=A0A0G3WHA2_9BACT|nr:glycosyltransferase 87 family protein [Endomicrobium proavitum]AKL97708.1 O-antigen ligase [Endomicrobium proavitum]
MSMLINKIKQNLRLEHIFISAMLVLCLCFIFSLAKNPSGLQVETLGLYDLSKNDGYFHDIYYPANYAADKNVYFNDRQPAPETFPKNYLPLVYVICYFFAETANYLELGIDARYSDIYLITVNLFIIFFSLMLFITLYDLKQGGKAVKFLTVASLFVSWAYIRAYQTGNFAIVSTVLSVFFLLSYDNKNKFIKELSFISLALAGAIKIYPLLFGIVLIYDKEYKAVFRIAVYFFIAAFTPFLFFTTKEHGFADNVLKCIDNIKTFSKTQIPYPFFIYPQHSFGAGAQLIVKLLVVMFKIFALLSLITAYFQNIKWKKIFLLLFTTYYLSSTAGVYYPLLFLMPIVLFFNEKKLTVKNLIFLLFVILLLNPYQFPEIAGYSITGLARRISLIAMFLMLFADSVIVSFYELRKKYFSKATLQ